MYFLSPPPYNTSNTRKNSELQMMTGQHSDDDKDTKKWD